MKLTVALTPRLLRDPRSSAVAVVDVLRATSSLVVMFDNGLLRAIVAENIQKARRLALANFSLLCGEVKALPPAGFDHGNSPADLSRVSFRGKSAVIMTTNGTRALAAAAQARAAFAASLLNRTAAAERLLAEAARLGVDAAVLCAGNERGTAFSLEDTVAAGAIVDAAREIDPALHLADDAWAAYHLWRWYRGDLARAFRHSAHARALAKMGLERDLAYAAQLDVTSTVPVLQRDGDIVVLRARSTTKKQRAPARR